MTACSDPPNRPPRDVIDRLIDDVAWARTCMIIAAAAPPGSPDREREMANLRRAVVEPRRAVDEIFGKGQSLPRDLIVELRACELYMQACALLWDNNNPTDAPVDEES